MNIKLIQKRLKKVNQEHLLTYYNQLNSGEKKELLKDIKRIDFSFINQLYKNSYHDEELNMYKIDKLNCISNLDQQLQKQYEKIGEKIIKNNEYAIVILAGGSASRLGLGLPKGCLELNVKEKRISLFEIYINQLKKIQKKYNLFLNLYIMTSSTNYNKITNFFKENNFFNYPMDKIFFFAQEDLPILNTDGKILLKEKNHILFGPNGNGNVFKSLKKAGLIKDMQKKKIKYVLFSTIDNVLMNLVDFSFIGATFYNNYHLASKTLTKKNFMEKDWIFCKYDKKPFMLPSKYINEKISNKKDEKGCYIYREKNITCHLISFDLIKKFSNLDLEYHRAYKKNNYLNLNGEMVIADSPNSFKFEQFIFDAFKFADDMLLYRIEEKEFCPIKTYEDIKKAEKILNMNIK